MTTRPTLFAVPSLIVLLALLILFSTPLAPGPAVHAGRLAGIASAGTSGLSVQNLDPAQSATVVVDFYKQGGGGPVSILLPSVAPEGAANLYLPSRPELANGAYAATISADRPIAALARTEWAASGGAAIYHDSPPGTDILVPLVTKAYMGYTSLISIQNTDPSASTEVEFSLHAMGESAAAVVVQLGIEAGTSITLDLAKSPHFLEVPAGFIGSARVTAPTPIAVQAFVDLETSRLGVYAFEGLPAEQAAEKLYAPMVHSSFPFASGEPDAPERSTLIALMNPGDSTVRTVTTFYGQRGACAGQSYTQGGSVRAGTNLVLSQSQDVTGPGATPLPANCAASAIVEAFGGPLVGVVADEIGDGVHTQASAYNAFAADGGALKTVLPLFRNKHTPAELTTGIYAMNVGAAQAHAAITFYDSRGNLIVCGQDCMVSIEPQAARLWWPPDIVTMPDNIFGHAVIESDQPLAVVVSDEALAGGFDASAFAGVQADAGAGSSDLHVSLLLLGASGAPPPFRTPTPTPTQVPTPTPTPAPAPELSLPEAIPARDGGRVRVPIELTSNGYEVGGVEMTLDFDERWLSFDPTDADGDGVPDSVRWHVDKLFQREFRFDPSATSGEIRVLVQTRGSRLRIPDGPLVDVKLDVAEGGDRSGAAVWFGEPPTFTDMDGRPIGGRAKGDGLRVPMADLSFNFLPYLDARTTGGT